MADSRAASRYVKSLLDLAVERNVLEDVHNDMVLFAETATKSRPLALLLQNPVIKHDQKLAVLKKAFGGKVHSLTMAFFEIITKKNREPILLAVAREFHNAYNEYKGIGRATVETATPLDDNARKSIEALVKAYSEKKQIELVETIDPELIGGFILKVGDRQVDASIKNKLKALKVQFSENPYIREL